MLVTVVNTLEVVSGTEPEISPDVGLLGAVIEPLTGVEDLLGNVVKGVIRMLEE